VLDKFLEFSVAAPDIGASLDFYRKLGFSEAGVGEAWQHAYAVLTDGRLCIGLHQHPAFERSLTFVKPELLKQVDALELMGLDFEFRHLAGDVFNQLGWLDPSGHVVRLVEARTFSPALRKVNDESLCGYFVEIALPAREREASMEHWERFGFVGMDEPDAALPHVSCTSNSVNVGLYDPAQLREPALMFEAGDFDAALRRLSAAGLAPAVRVPAPRRDIRVAALHAPEGTALLIVEKVDP
jgi:catechol 2,3-dioxygenase-like lactoylglutathione lyase family enzyme